MKLSVLLIILGYFVLIVTDLLIISDFRKFSLYQKFGPVDKPHTRWWKIYAVFAILVLALFTVAISFPHKTSGSGLTSVMWMLYIVMSVIFSQVIYSIFSLLGLLPRLFRQRRWNTGLWVGLPLGILIFSAMWWGTLIGRNRIKIENIEISSPKIPQGFDGFKIAQISDLHLGTWGEDTSFIDRMVDSINNQKPDIIVFTGDAVNRESREFLPFIRSLSALKAPFGVYTVLGNHDYGDYIRWNSPLEKTANLDSLKSYERLAGWKLLDNDFAYLVNSNNDSILLLGVGNWGEPPFKQYGNIELAYPSEIRDNKFKILLSHNPEHWNQEISKKTDIDLTLSGHTHAMQIMLALGDFRWSPSKFKYDQWSGLYERPSATHDSSKVYVNIGIGEVGIPMRIGADPEITILTLRSTK